MFVVSAKKSSLFLILLISFSLKSFCSSSSQEESFLKTLNKTSKIAYLVPGVLAGVVGLLCGLDSHSLPNGLASTAVTWSSASKVVAFVLFTIAKVRSKLPMSRDDREQYNRFASKQATVFSLSLAVTVLSTLILMVEVGGDDFQPIVV